MMELSSDLQNCTVRMSPIAQIKFQLQEIYVSDTILKDNEGLVFISSTRCTLVSSVDYSIFLYKTLEHIVKPLNV